MSRINRVVFLATVLVLGFIQMGNAEEKSQQKAVEAAQTWLVLVDQGEFGKSWETASDYFKGAVTEKQWQQALTAVRSPLGKVTTGNSSRNSTPPLCPAPQTENTW